MRLRFSLVLVLALLAAVFVAPMSASASPSVAARHTAVLGQKHLFAPGGRGWGHAHPATIYNGGDPERAGQAHHLEALGQP